LPPKLRRLLYSEVRGWLFAAQTTLLKCPA
jgi:hypothetical protein